MFLVMADDKALVRDRTDQLLELLLPPDAPSCIDPGRLAPSRPVGRSTSTNTGSASGATKEGQLISSTGSGAVAGATFVPASANSAAARSSPESKALPSPNHSSSWIEAPPTVAIAPVLITTQ